MKYDNDGPKTLMNFDLQCDVALEGSAWKETLYRDCRCRCCDVAGVRGRCCRPCVSARQWYTLILYFVIMVKNLHSSC